MASFCSCPAVPHGLDVILWLSNYPGKSSLFSKLLLPNICHLLKPLHTVLYLLIATLKAGYLFKPDEKNWGSKSLSNLLNTS